jgi:hypothetical protein
MQLKTLLNRVYKHKSFVYTDVKMTQEKDNLVLTVRIEACLLAGDVVVFSARDYFVTLSVKRTYDPHHC